MLNLDSYQNSLFALLLKKTIMVQYIEPHILKDYQIHAKLGKGAYGIVWKAVDKKNSQTVALKKIFDAFHNVTDAQRTYRQVAFLKQLKGHQNIIGLRNVIRAQNNKDLYLVFDFMETDLHAVIRAGILEQVHRKYIMYQIIKAMKYIHSAQLVHRDLKPSNILLNQQCQAKIADFGLARSISAENNTQEAVMTEYVATRWYRAPQVVLGSSTYSKAVDMWSIGCIMAELYLGKSLFPGKSTINQIQKIVQLLGKPSQSDINSWGTTLAKQCLDQIPSSKKKGLSYFFGNLSTEAFELLRSLLVYNPQKRLTAEQALKHKYFSQFSDPKQEKECKPIKIDMDQNTKFTIVQYRQQLYYGRKKRVTSCLGRKGQISRSQKKVPLGQTYVNYKMKKYNGQ